MSDSHSSPAASAAAQESKDGDGQQHHDEGDIRDAYRARSERPLEAATNDFPEIPYDPAGSGKGLLTGDNAKALKAIKKASSAMLKDDTDMLQELQSVLYAENKHKILIVFQAMDSGGKDGTIRKVLGPVNPQGVNVVSFKSPSEEERSHDFLWRIHKHTPANGMIGVFNRSHYEDALITRVHGWVTHEEADKRLAHIANWEKYLADQGVVIIKFFLHISNLEQKRRLQRRLDRPDKHWKFAKSDAEERKLWDNYIDAYNKAISATNTDQAPWYVIPADLKWRRNALVARILRLHLQELDMHYPEPEEGLDQVVLI